MKRLRFTAEQIIGILKEAEAGVKTPDLARRDGVSEAMIYNWKSNYGGLEVFEDRRPKELESENAKLKRLLHTAKEKGFQLPKYPCLSGLCGIFRSLKREWCTRQDSNLWPLPSECRVYAQSGTS